MHVTHVHFEQKVLLYKKRQTKEAQMKFYVGPFYVRLDGSEQIQKGGIPRKNQHCPMYSNLRHAIRCSMSSNHNYIKENGSIQCLANDCVQVFFCFACCFPYNTKVSFNNDTNYGGLPLQSSALHHYDAHSLDLHLDIQ